MTTSDEPCAPGVQPLSRWPELHPTTQAAYNLILWRGGLPRIEIARLLGMSRTRLSQITKDLEDAGLIVEGPREQRSTTGRPAEVLLARPDRAHLLGVTIRAGAVIGAVVDLEKRVVWERTSLVAMPTVEIVVDHVRRWYAEAVDDGFGITGIGVTAPGSAPTSPATGVHASDLGHEVDWGVPVPVWTQEDVFALTTFEQWPRLGHGEHSMVLLALGEEIGFGIVSDQKVVAGAHRAAGRFGHVHVDDDGGPACPVGHRGCLWSASSTGAVLAAVPGADRPQTVVDAASAGSAAADAVLRRAARGAGTAVAQVVNLLDPDKVVVTGEMSVVVRTYRADFEHALAEGVVSGVDPVVEISATDVVQWAQAAASYAQYRLLATRVDPS